jgi:glycerophosphoryl diester phosphodiesterase
MLALVLVCMLMVAGGASEMQAIKRPLNVAHRGGAGLAPENTLAAFQRALTLPVDAVELDVHMSQDGVVIVIHDADLRRTTGHVGAIHTLTLAELRTFNAAATYQGEAVASQPIPTLAEVLALVHGRAGVQIEIKQRADKQRYAGIEAQVVEAVQRYDMLTDVVVISFDFPTLQDVKALEPRIATCALLSSTYLCRFDIRREAMLVVDDLAMQGFRCVGVQHTLLTEALFRALRQRDFGVGVWTVNEPFAMRQFVAMGVDFITSDRPDLLREMFQ